MEECDDKSTYSAFHCVKKYILAVNKIVVTSLSIIMKAFHPRYIKLNLKYAVFASSF